MLLMCSFHGGFAQSLLTGLGGDQMHLTTFIPHNTLELQNFLSECQSLPEREMLPEGSRRKDAAASIHRCGVKTQ